MNNMEHIKPGDRVLVIIGSFEDGIATVERITKTQIILANGTRYRRTDGYFIESSIWNRIHIRGLTEEDILHVTYRDPSPRQNARSPLSGKREHQRKRD